MDNERLSKIMLNYGSNGRRQLGRRLRILLDETEIKAYFVTDDDDDDNDDDI